MDLVAESLNSTDSKVKSDIIYEMNHLVQHLLIKDTGVTFCWIPSDCGLTFNAADRAAKRGAINNNYVVYSNKDSVVHL